MLCIRKAVLFDLSSMYSEAMAGGVQYGHIPSPPACPGGAAHRGVPCLAAGPSTLPVTPLLGSDGSCCPDGALQLWRRWEGDVGQVLRPSTTRSGCMQQEHAAGGTGCQDARTGLSDACSMAVSSTE